MIAVSQAGFAYPHTEAVLTDVSCELHRGERVVLLGANGSGKTTLARLMNASLCPSSGEVRVDGTVTTAPSASISSRVGMIRQDPQNQLVSAAVYEEVAFGPSNLGLAKKEIDSRVDEALALCGITCLRHRATHGLSGGEQQLVALASTLALSPRYLLLDEVYAQLDGYTRAKIRSRVDALVDEGMGVLELSHSVESLWGADRVIWLDGGCIAWSGSPNDFLSNSALAARAGMLSTEFSRVLQSAVAKGFNLSGRCSLPALAAFMREKGLVAEGRRLLSNAHATAIPSLKPQAKKLALIGATVTHDGMTALSRCSLEAEGELVLVAGRSGSGKTTAAQVIAGVIQPQEGGALLDGEAVRLGSVGLAFQNSENQVFADTVFNDIAFGPQARGLAGASLENCVFTAAQTVDLEHALLERSPFELSGGQLRRVALAGLMACHFTSFVLDEPTAGLDSTSRQRIRAAVRKLADDGSPVVVISHDVGEWLAFADRIVFMADGHAVASVSASEAQTREDLYQAAGLEAPLSVQLLSCLTDAEKGGVDAYD